LVDDCAAGAGANANEVWEAQCVSFVVMQWYDQVAVVPRGVRWSKE